MPEISRFFGVARFFRSYGAHANMLQVLGMS
jgi:hypothetical protein